MPKPVTFSSSSCGEPYPATQVDELMRTADLEMLRDVDTGNCRLAWIVATVPRLVRNRMESGGGRSGAVRSFRTSVAKGDVSSDDAFAITPVTGRYRGKGEFVTAYESEAFWLVVDYRLAGQGAKLLRATAWSQEAVAAAAVTTVGWLWSSVDKGAGALKLHKSRAKDAVIKVR